MYGWKYYIIHLSSVQDIVVLIIMNVTFILNKNELCAICSKCMVGSYSGSMNSNYLLWPIWWSLLWKIYLINYVYKKYIVLSTGNITNIINKYSWNTISTSFIYLQLTNTCKRVIYILSWVMAIICCKNEMEIKNGLNVMNAINHGIMNV